MKTALSNFFKPIVSNFITVIATTIATAILTIPSTLYISNLQLQQNTNLNVSGKYYSFQLPPTIRTFEDSYRHATHPDKLREIATNSGRLDTVVFEPFSYVLYKYLRDLSVIEEVREATYFESFWIFTLENNASKKLENVTLLLPFNGYYEILNEESESILSDSYESKIDVGDLKPSNIAVIKVWSNEIPWKRKGEPYYSSNPPRVTFDNGFKLVDFSQGACLDKGC